MLVGHQTAVLPLAVVVFASKFDFSHSFFCFHISFSFSLFVVPVGVVAGLGVYGVASQVELVLHRCSLFLIVGSPVKGLAGWRGLMLVLIEMKSVSVLEEIINMVGHSLLTVLHEL